MDSVSNHVKPYWPTEATTASDSEDPGAPERLRVETKVNVELHTENKLNHVGDVGDVIERPVVGNSRDTASPNQTVANHHHHQQLEQRKGAERKKKSSVFPSYTNCVPTVTSVSVRQCAAHIFRCSNLALLSKIVNSASSSAKSYGYISNSKKVSRKQNYEKFSSGFHSVPINI